MKKSVTAILLSILSQPTISQAAPESWYSYWSIGIANHDHTAQLDQEFESIDSQSYSIIDIPRLQNAFDLLGFYWPVKKSGVAGVVLNMTRDSASSLGSSIEVTTELYGLSYMQFMGMEPGKGFFLRGDIGRAKVNVHLNKAFEAPYDVSESGTGYLFGVGYAAALSSRSRILFGFNLSKRKVDLGSFKSSQVVVGMLW